MTQLPLVLVFMGSLVGSLATQAPRLVKDINQRLTPTPSSPRPTADPISREPSQFWNVLDRTYFVARDARRGTELFETQGTAATTKMVKDIWWGDRSSNPSDIMSDGWRLFFSADDGSHGREMWVAEPLYRRVTKIEINKAPAESSNPAEFFHLDGTIVFQAEAQLDNCELWASDGTAANTRLVMDIAPAFGASSLPQNFVEYDGMAYFHAFDGKSVGLWKTDGHRSGTSRVSDVNVDFEHGAMMVFEKELYFVGSTSTTGLELYKTDGTAQGTVLVHDVAPGRTGSDIGQMVVFGGDLYFTALGINPATRGSTGLELWKTDGTTLTLFDIWKGEEGSDPHSFVVHEAERDSGLFFAASGTNPATGLPTGEELWRMGSFGLQLFELAPNADSSHPRGMACGALGYLYFSSENPYQGPEVWRSDGTLGGTKLFAALNSYGPQFGSNPRFFTPHHAAGMLFTCDDGPHGEELWCSDGTVAGTKLLIDINPQTTNTESSRPVLRATVGDTVYFTAEDGTGGPAMWMTDGTSTGTTRVGGLATLSVKEIGETVSVGNQVFVVGRGRDSKGQPTGMEIWVVDHTSGHTKLLDIQTGTGSSDPRDLIEYRGGVLFSAVGNLNLVGENIGRELWRSDGTEAGTFLVKDIHTKRVGLSIPSGSPRKFYVHRGLVYFAAEESAHGTELWVTDGTEAGTRLVKDINPGGEDSHPHGFVTVNDKLLFVATNLSYGAELWVSDGSTAGTSVIDIRKGPGSGFPRLNLKPDANLVEAGGYAYFSADGDLNQAVNSIGQELWRSDGTLQGTELVADVWPGAGSSDPDAIVQVGSSSRVMFLSPVGSGLAFSGPALWASDGTAAGTVMIQKLSPNWLGRGVTLSRPFGGRHCVLQIPYFVPIIGQVGFEVFVSDGTPAGTTRIASDYYAMHRREHLPTILPSHGGRLFFTRVDPNYGSEVWLREGLATATEIGQGCTFGAAAPTLSCNDPLFGDFVRPVIRTAPFSIGMLMLGAWSSDPLVLSKDCFLRVSLNGPTVFIPVASDGVGHWSSMLSTNRGRIGYRYAIQAALSEPPRTGTLALTNGVVLTMGQ